MRDKNTDKLGPIKKKGKKTTPNKTNPQVKDGHKRKLSRRSLTIRKMKDDKNTDKLDSIKNKKKGKKLKTKNLKELSDVSSESQSQSDMPLNKNKYSSNDPKKWDEEDVCTWLKESFIFGYWYEKNFYDNGINGKRLFRLKKNILLSQLKVKSRIHAIRIIREIKDMKMKKYSYNKKNSSLKNKNDGKSKKIQSTNNRYNISNKRKVENKIIKNKKNSLNENINGNNNRKNKRVKKILDDTKKLSTEEFDSLISLIGRNNNNKMKGVSGKREKRN